MKAVQAPEQVPHAQSSGVPWFPSELDTWLHPVRGLLHNPAPTLQAGRAWASEPACGWHGGPQVMVREGSANPVPCGPRVLFRLISVRAW